MKSSLLPLIAACLATLTLSTLAAERADVVAKAEALMQQARVDDPNFPMRAGKPPKGAAK